VRFPKKSGSGEPPVHWKSMASGKWKMCSSGALVCPKQPAQKWPLGAYGCFGSLKGLPEASRPAAELGGGGAHEPNPDSAKFHPFCVLFVLALKQSAPRLPR
jgi:hypothetical protein